MFYLYFLFIAICFWQWFTVHGLRETAQNLLANKVWIFIACDPWTQQIGEALKLGTRYYKHTSPKGQWRLHSLCPKLPHITACPHPLCLTQYLPSNEFQIVFVKRKRKQKTDRQAQDGETWMECKCGKVCISSVYHKELLTCRLLQTGLQSWLQKPFHTGFFPLWDKAKKELLYMTTITCNYLVTWDFTNHIQLLWYVSISQSVHKIISQFGKWHMLRSAPARSN